MRAKSLRDTSGTVLPARLLWPWPIQHGAAPRTMISEPSPRILWLRFSTVNFTPVPARRLLMLALLPALGVSSMVRSTVVGEDPVVGLS